MSKDSVKTFLDYFDEIEDPRSEKGKLYSVNEIFLVVISQWWESFMTQIQDQYRREQIQKSLNVYYDEQGDKGLKKTLSVEYRGNIKILPVIRIDPSALLLNHNKLATMSVFLSWLELYLKVPSKVI